MNEGHLPVLLEHSARTVNSWPLPLSFLSELLAFAATSLLLFYSSLIKKS